MFKEINKVLGRDMYYFDRLFKVYTCLSLNDILIIKVAKRQQSWIPLVVSLGE